MSNMRHIDYHTARALQEQRLAQAQLIADRREAVRRQRLGLRLGLAAKLGANPKRLKLGLRPKTG